MPGSLTTPGRPGARDGAPGRVAFRKMHCVGTQNRKLSRLNGWPMRPPVNASPRPSRAPAHDSGPMRIATPSSQGTCTLYSLPVSQRLAYVFRSTPNCGHRQARLACLSRADAVEKGLELGGQRLESRALQLLEQRTTAGAENGRDRLWAGSFPTRPSTAALRGEIPLNPNVPRTSLSSFAESKRSKPESVNKIAISIVYPEVKRVCMYVCWRHVGPRSPSLFSSTPPER
jgi:hypothetical protein